METVYGNNEALLSYRFDQLLCWVTALISYPRARFHALYQKLVYDCFSCISYEFILILTENINVNTALFFFIVVYELTTSFITVEWHGIIQSTRVLLHSLGVRSRFSSTGENSRKPSLICNKYFILNTHPIKFQFIRRQTYIKTSCFSIYQKGLFHFKFCLIILASSLK